MFWIWETGLGDVVSFLCLDEMGEMGRLHHGGNVRRWVSGSLLTGWRLRRGLGGVQPCPLWPEAVLATLRGVLGKSASR